MHNPKPSNSTSVFALASVCILAWTLTTYAAEPDHATDTKQTTANSREDDYLFDGAISREVLENYLDPSVTIAYFLVTGNSEGRREYPYHDDDVRLIKNVGAKFIGRAIYRRNGESRLNDQEFWQGAKTLMDKVHAHDANVIFQGCLFNSGSIISQEPTSTSAAKHFILAKFDL